MVYWHFTRNSFAKSMMILFFVLQVSACDNSGSSTIATEALVVDWATPSERADGSILPQSEIRGYRVYYGQESGNYTDQLDINDNAAEQIVVPIEPGSGAYFFVVTTIDVEGRESVYSSPETQIEF